MIHIPPVSTPLLLIIANSNNEFRAGLLLVGADPIAAL
jgi:hypothetical protein